LARSAPVAGLLQVIRRLSEFLSRSSPAGVAIALAENIEISANSAANCRQLRSGEPILSLSRELRPPGRHVKLPVNGAWRAVWQGGGQVPMMKPV